MKKKIFMGMMMFFSGLAPVWAAEAPAAPAPKTAEQPLVVETKMTAAEAAVVQKAQQQLTQALDFYDAGDLVKSEKAALQAASLLYSGEPQKFTEESAYADVSSKLALLIVRLNRFLYDVSPELESEQFSMPVPYNERIERQIDGYVTKSREEFARWLRRSGRYVPTLKQYFVQEGMPGDLVYIALVESGFNPRNRSTKAAVGLFQFMKQTAEMVGLKEDSWVDERRHPKKAALAAIRHLKSLYQEFGDWDLALAAYNCGSGRLWQSIRDQGTRDFWKLSLPPETEAYVPKFYATLIIAREPELYGFNPNMESEKDVEEVEIPGGVDLKVIADCLGVTSTVVADMNPELTKGCTPPGADSYLLRVPANTAEKFQKIFAELPKEKKFLSQEEIGRRKFKGFYVVYQVRHGDSLYSVARKHHTTVTKLRQWNNSLKKNKYIYPGQQLRIYRMN
jgi:membrane-bound lytic murein transglycosylase D